MRRTAAKTTYKKFDARKYRTTLTNSIQRLAVLELEHGHARYHDKYAAHDGNFGEQSLGHKGAEPQPQQVQAALPAEQHRRRKRYADAVGGGQHHGGHKVQRSIREQKGVIAVHRAFDGAEYGQRADAEEQDSRGKTAPQFGMAEARGKALKLAVPVPHRSQQGAERQAQDEQHRILTVGHIGHNRVHAQRKSRKAHGVEKRVLVFFADAAPKHRTDGTAAEYGDGIDDSACHGNSFNGVEQ